jgi:uncharacterized sporulation protein YeaH/YhbH (DUF444 family)
MVHPGNDQFVSGDKIDRPKGGGGGRLWRRAGLQPGEGADDFVFQISATSSGLLFEDLELPMAAKPSSTS